MNAGPFLATCLGCVFLPGIAQAGACQVPGAVHATIQQAADDPACSTVVLSTGSHPESARIRRSLGLSGSGSATTVVEGRLEVSDAVTVSLSGFAIANGCPQPGLLVLAGADVSVQDVAIGPAVVPCPELSYPIFRSGFEPQEAVTP